jgi:hypothetical protein
MLLCCLQLLLCLKLLYVGAYHDPTYQPAKFCSIGPNPAWAPNSTANWPTECGRVLVGSVCTAACGTKATGVDYTARCDDSDTWTFLGGGCNSKHSIACLQ